MGETIARIFHWNQRLFSLLPGIMLCIVSAASVPRAYQFPKQDFSGARDFVRVNLKASDRVVGVHMAGRMFQLYYAPNWPEINNLEELKTARSANGNTWVIYTLPGHLEAIQPELMNHLDTNYSLTATFPGTLGDGTIYIRTSKPLEKSNK